MAEIRIQKTLAPKEFEPKVRQAVKEAVIADPKLREEEYSNALQETVRKILMKADISETEPDELKNAIAALRPIPLAFHLKHPQGT